MERKTAVELWELVKANRKRLDTCERPHNFLPIPGARPMLTPHRCTKCLGEVDSIQAAYYRDGLEDGQRLAAQAAPGTTNGPKTGPG